MGIGQQFMKATNSDMPQNALREQGVKEPYLEVIYDGKSELVQIPEPDFLDDVEGSFLELIELRSSVRQYGGEEMTLKQLSLLLWCTQGVKMVTDRTVRNVPSAGGRHAFETYLLIRNVEGIAPGVYRFLAIEHLLVKVGGEEMMNEIASRGCTQPIVQTASVVFFWAAQVDRMTWRFGERGYRYLMIDAGHICQNLYLTAGAIKFGACAIGAFDDNAMNEILGLDGENAFVLYGASVGK